MSVSSPASKTTPLSGRLSNITAADVFQVVAWAALSVIVFVYAIAEASIGGFGVAAIVALQAWGAWTGAVSREERAQRGLVASQGL